MGGAKTDPSEMPAEAGPTAVALARRSLEELLAPDPATARASVPASGPLADFFAAPRGVFVTLLTYPDADLRGCIGFPRAFYPLREALPKATRAAALEDPRFRPVAARELPHLLIEVSLLTDPVRLPEEERDSWPARIQVGRDGLIVEDRYDSGLLLPQVAPEQGWDAEAFLAGTCEKAGLRRDAWRRPDVHVSAFQALVFREERPRGPAVPHRA